jgi:sn-glycerol 3-phosphate transport system ATP-binding protein
MNVTIAQPQPAQMPDKTPQGATLRLRDLVKRYATGPAAVAGINLDVAADEFVVLVGPSGCGKSTTLRLIAGLETATSGDIEINGARVNHQGAAQRDVAMVFQNYALYPHMTVAQNIGFGLRRRGVSRAGTRIAVAQAARALALEDLLHRMPSDLSGGQKQRVAMGRAIVRNPRLFLFDEPLSNLDARLRLTMRTQIKRMHAKVPTTTIYVTHDQTEAMTMADRVVVMNAGQIAQIGTPMEIYNAPVSRFVAEFIGAPAMTFADGMLSDTALTLRGGVRLPAPATTHRGPVTLGLRPEALRMADTGLPARLELLEPLGAETLALWQTDALGPVWVRLDPRPDLRPGATGCLQPDMTRAHLFDPASGLRLV